MFGAMNFRMFGPMAVVTMSAGDGFEQVFEIRRAVDGAHAFDVDALGLVADDLDVVST